LIFTKFRPGCSLTYIYQTTVPNFQRIHQHLQIVEWERECLQMQQMQHNDGLNHSTPVYIHMGV
jgi:hypothetical protein